MDTVRIFVPQDIVSASDHSGVATSHLYSRLHVKLPISFRENLFGQVCSSFLSTDVAGDFISNCHLTSCVIQKHVVDQHDDQLSTSQQAGGNGVEQMEHNKLEQQTNMSSGQYLKRKNKPDQTSSHGN